MIQPHVSATHFYSSVVLVAILLLAIPDPCSSWPWFPTHHTYGHARPTDGRIVRYVNLPASDRGKVIYKTQIKLSRKITCIDIIDNMRSDIDIWMSRYPPCFNPEISVRSEHLTNLNLRIEIYVQSR